MGFQHFLHRNTLFPLSMKFLTQPCIKHSRHDIQNICVYIYVCVCMWGCVCVRERDTYIAIPQDPDLGMLKFLIENGRMLA